MPRLREKIRSRIPKIRALIKDEILNKHAGETVGNVTVKQVYGGMRGVIGLVCNSSYVDPYKGLHIRGIPLDELTETIPEEIFYLLCTGEIPVKEDLERLQEELKLRAEVPEYVWDVLRTLPKDTHPMTMFSIAIMAMEGESIFKEKYAAGMRKSDYWEATLDDSLEIIAKLPSIAAGIYRIRYSMGDLIPYDKSLDWGGNYAKMLGVPDPKGEFAKLVRLYLVLHCDHEGGNVSAFTSRVVNSALSNLYYAVSAGLNGLAGPLHGLANQECLKFVLSIQEKFDKAPSKKELVDFVLSTLKVGKVVPGYGHAVLRATDPRFTAFYKFGEKYCAKEETFLIVKRLFEVVPDILKEYGGGKIADPYPNVDAISGSLLFKYGLTMFDYYTVMFGVSRVLGFCAQAIMARGLQAPIIRPKSVTNEWIFDKLGIKKK
ncbi:MAG: citrate (Si)-synthase [Armatimonadetes bacterium]|nr:citrate (Si)-synthase [Armatimonadota bacterium]